MGLGLASNAHLSEVRGRPPKTAEPVGKTQEDQEHLRERVEGRVLDPLLSLPSSCLEQSVSGTDTREPPRQSL